MKRFAVAHATHPDWSVALSLVIAQLKAALDGVRQLPRLGLVYFTDHLAAHAASVLHGLRQALPEVGSWSGTVSYGVLADEAEYANEPALAVMLCDLAESDFCVFSGIAPLPAHFDAYTALVHADARMIELDENVREMAARMASGRVFGALSASRTRVVQLAHQPGQETGESVLEGGLAGVVFSRCAGVQSRLIHGCRPIAREHVLTKAEGPLLLTLDGEPALDVLLDDLQLTPSRPREALLAMSDVMVAIDTNPQALRRYAGQLSATSRVRLLTSVDPLRNALALPEAVEPGATVTFCRRDIAFARAEIKRVCTELRESLEPEFLDPARARQHLLAQADASDAHAHWPHAGLSDERIAGAIYMSCVGRGEGYFGPPDDPGASGAELQLLRRALGPVPLVGLLAGGEIEHDTVHGFSGVLTVFLND